MTTRRTVLRRGGLAAGGAMLLAGCGQSETESSPVPGFDPEGRVLAAVAPTNQQPSDFQLNRNALGTRGRGVVAPFQQLVLPADAPTGAFRTSGHTVTVDGEEVTVPCAVTEYDVDGTTVTRTFESGLTYWNGDALDARAFALGDRVTWHAFREFGESFPGELVDGSTYRWTVPGPETSADVRRAVAPGAPPLPPSFTEAWVERFDGASTADESEAVYADLNDETVDLARFVEGGYGSGAYRIESTDATSREGIGAVRRDDHPGDVAVPNLVVRTPAPASLAGFVNGGSVDVGEGIIAERGGDFQAGSVPDDLDQLVRYPSPVEPGTQLFFNWGRTHCRRLWVRRALIAALPVPRIVSNAFGTDRRPLGQHSGLLSETARVALGREFVDSLVQYPVDADRETAGEWLRTAGYTEADGGWNGPDGEALSLTLLVGERAGPLASSVENGLTEFGVAVDLETLSVRPSNRFEPAVLSGEWDLAVGLSPGGLSPVPSFASAPAIEGPSLFAAAGSVAGTAVGDCEGSAEWVGTPGTVTVPAEPGALRIEGASYEDGGTVYTRDGGEDVSVCDAVGRLSAPDADERQRRAAARTCARWYNYAVPTFVFGQAQVGCYGNTGQFVFPEADGALRTATPDDWSPARYHVQAGTIR